MNACMEDLMGTGTIASLRPGRLGSFLSIKYSKYIRVFLVETIVFLKEYPNPTFCRDNLAWLVTGTGFSCRP